MNDEFNTNEEMNETVIVSEKKKLLANPKMKKVLTIAVAAILFFALGIGGGYLGASIANEQGSGSSPRIIKTSATTKATSDVSKIAESASDTIVEISTSSVSRGSFMQQYVSEGAGSGVILTSDGYIITNNHVVSGATTIKVTTKDGTEYDAKLIGTDSGNDVAVLKIEASGLTVAAVGDSDNLDVGETVVAIGNPLGSLGGTVTEGIISATSRTITIDNVDMTLLQTSAAINPGNSGGGLFNTNGELIGVVNAKSSGEDIEGLGFAIPVNKAIEVANQIMENGFSDGNYTLGIRMIEVDNISQAKQYGYSETGIYIYEVVSGSDAESAGLKANDKLVSINKKKIAAYTDASEIIKGAKKGDVLQIVVERDGSQKTIEVKV